KSSQGIHHVGGKNRRETLDTRKQMSAALRVDGRGHGWHRRPMKTPLPQSSGHPFGGIVMADKSVQRSGFARGEEDRPHENVGVMPLPAAINRVLDMFVGKKSEVVIDVIA